MRNYVLVSVFLVLIAFIVSGSTVQMAKEEPSLYENMVNASVKLYNDFGGGSGVFIADNVILTAAHVLKDEDSYKIELRGGTVLESSDFYIDTEEDVGFIFIDANEICIAKVERFPVAIGDTVYLVGVPHNKFYKFTLTKGILSHLDRDLPEWGWKDLLQADAEGGYGSSGGPLYDSVGHVIGIYVGHAGKGGIGISLYESAQSILEAYERCLDAR